MSVAQKKKKKPVKGARTKPDLAPFNILDAYVDSSADPKPDVKPLSTKNKNKKKLEQRQAEEAAAAAALAESKATEETVIDSWEDLDPDFEPKTLDRTKNVENESRISKNEAKLPKNEPKVSKTVPKASKNEPKASKSEPKVSKNEPKPAQIPKTEPKVPKSEPNPAQIPKTEPKASKSEPKPAQIPKTEPKASKSEPKPAQIPKRETETWKTSDSRPDVKEALAQVQMSLDAVSDLFAGVKISNGRTAENSEKSIASESIKSVKIVDSKPTTKDNTNQKDSMSAEEATKTNGPDSGTKSKEEIKAEREAKKAAKAAKRAGNKAPESAKHEPSSVSELDGNENTKSKAELKAERRAKQEAQRAVKETAAAKEEPEPEEPKKEAAEKPKKKETKVESPATRKTKRKGVSLFSHLPQYEKRVDFDLPFVGGGAIHPAIVRLGLRYSEGSVSGSNARCVALLHALKTVINDYVTPPKKELPRDLDAALKPQFDFLQKCRAHSASMENAFKFLRSKINALDPCLSDDEAKGRLTEEIDEFVRVNIELAAKQISLTARDKIKDGDVILTYGHSSLIRSVFIEAFQSGIRFRVVVADARPKLEGQEMIRHLVKAGIKCTYVLITAAPYVMQEVSKVIIGACAVFANGAVNSRVGTSEIALIAKAANVPVLVCCETYKFSERVQTDSFVFNELGESDDLVTKNGPLEGWRDLEALNLLNLSYDITPACFVDAIITEISVIPVTSVPVVLRLKNSEVH